MCDSCAGILQAEREHQRGAVVREVDAMVRPLLARLTATELRILALALDHGLRDAGLRDFDLSYWNDGANQLAAVDVDRLRLVLPVAVGHALWDGADHAILAPLLTQEQERG